MSDESDLWFNHPAYIGFANTLPKDDEQLPKFKFQFEERGFDSTVVWNLNVCIGQYVVPRLQAYIEESGTGYPSHLSSYQEWRDILDKMLLSFHSLVTDDVLSQSEETKVKVREGFELFAEYVHYLWY